ncbi:ATP-binding protein [Luteolibacter marinus]|uniref:nSTAND1 domain-containing NTPase n=1 Tax=Luteolibacter marinus TaxID=2776705 RepID=UPI0018672067|nr:ATP-binding protein [Luteolibacter marinus]
MQALTLFVTTPGDVHDERPAVGRVVEALQRRYRSIVRLEVLGPRSTAVEEGRIGADDCDLVVAVLGSEFRPQEDAGIERLLESALASRTTELGQRALVYRRQAPPARSDKGKAFEAFCRRVFSGKTGAVPTFFDDAGDLAERFEQDLRAILVQRFGESETEPLEGLPFPDGRAFDYDDAARYFGRDRPLAEALGQLKSQHAAGQPFLLVYGDPAAGKSSMLRAGLAPRLTADGFMPDVGAWCGLTVPAVDGERAPLETLAQAICEALPELARIRDSSRPAVKPGKKSKKGRRSKSNAAAEPVWDQDRLLRALNEPAEIFLAVTAITAALDRVSVGKPAQMLVMIDPLDGLFASPEVTAELREGYFRVLAALVKSRRVWMVATLRSEFFPRVSEHRDLFRLVRDGGFFLGPPDEPELRTIVRLPLLAAGMEFEADPQTGGDLSDRITGDALGAAQVLPRLAGTLNELAGEAEGDLLTAAAYQRLGGLAGRAWVAPPAVKPVAAGNRTLRAAGLVFAGLALGLIGAAWWSGKPGVAAPEAKVQVDRPDTAAALATAAFELGKARIAEGSPGAALPRLLEVLDHQPEHLDAQAMLLGTLRTTAWHFPVAGFDHPLPVTALAFDDRGASLFSAVGGEAGGYGTTLRWSLDEGTIDALLKPLQGAKTRWLSIAPGGRRLVVQRGDAVVLCDAVTMRPVRSLPLAPEAGDDAVAWSAEGALIAYPVKSGDGYAWVIADATSGATVRESGPFAAGDPLSARLDRVRLRAVHSDGTLVELPLAPDQPLRSAISDQRFSQAELAADATYLLAQVPGQTPRAFELADDGETLRFEDSGITRPAAWLESRGPDLGLPASLSDLAGEPEDAPLVIDGRDVRMPGSDALRFDAPVDALAVRGPLVAAGFSSGRVMVHRVLPPAGYPLDGSGAGDEPPADGAGASGSALAPDGRQRVEVVGDGVVLVRAQDGERLSTVESLEGAGRVLFVDESRVAVTCRRGVVFLDTAGNRLERLAEIPVENASDLQWLPHSGVLAVATATRLLLVDPATRSITANLPMSGGAGGFWAEDGESGWLARASGRDLMVWSPHSSAVILKTRIPAGGPLAFAEQDGMRGVGGAFGFIPLAKAGGLDPEEREALRWFCRGLGGAGLEAAGGLSITARREALGHDFGKLDALLPGMKPGALGESVRSLPFTTNAPAAWLPLWKRLAMTPGIDEARLIRWSSSLGDHPWFKQYLRGRIARSDVDLDLAWQGGEVDSASTAWMHGLAGDSDEVQALKQAAWLAAGTDGEGSDEALALLDGHAAATLEAFHAVESPGTALAHAEALAWRGKAGEAMEFLDGKIPADTELTLAQCHFLLSFGLAHLAPDAVDAALDRLDSPWLWRQWLQSGESELPVAQMAGRTMDAVDGRGPAAVEALWVSMAERDAEAIAVCLKAAKELPPAMQLCATGVALWAEGRKAEAFALWPDGFPDLAKEAAEGDWDGWEGVLPGADEESLFATMEKELATLFAGPDAGPEELKALASRLMDPETATTFGVKRVRDAMMTCALALANDPDAYKEVAEMVEQARLAGAPPTECLRIEARSYMAAGNFTLAYSRWLRLVESIEGEIFASDYLDAARCVMEDMQDVAAIELLMRGKRQFPDDASFAYGGAWLLLTSGHPEEAGVLLEHGFEIPFTGDEKAIATAMLVCAAEQTQRTARADEAFQDLLAIDPNWGEETSLEALEWPDWLKQVLMTVAGRQP